MGKLAKLIIAIVVCEGVGLAGAFFTFPSIATWYSTLNKPAFSPPSWIFGPVWTILYLLMGVAVYLVWVKGWENKKVKEALIYFTVQLILNFLWSVFFFGLHSPLLAFVDIVLLWLAILLTILKFYKISKSAAYLLIPYLLWVTFASILNLSIVLLNP